MIFEAFALKDRSVDAGLAWTEAWSRGPAWREALSKGRVRLQPSASETLRQAIVQACAEEGADPAAFGAMDGWHAGAS